MNYQSQLGTLQNNSRARSIHIAKVSVDKLRVATASDQGHLDEAGLTSNRLISQVSGPLPISPLPPPRRVQPPLKFLHPSPPSWLREYDFLAIAARVDGRVAEVASS